MLASNDQEKAACTCLEPLGVTILLQGYPGYAVPSSLPAPRRLGTLQLDLISCHWNSMVSYMIHVLV
jgi:hypothetical protein